MGDHVVGSEDGGNSRRNCSHRQNLLDSHFLQVDRLEETQSDCDPAHCDPLGRLVPLGVSEEDVGPARQ